MTHIINRSVALFAALAILSLGLTAFAAPPNWTMQSNSSLIFTCDGNPYAHTLTSVSQDGAGNLTGSGSYDANGAYTWNMTGTVDGDAVAMTITYTGLQSGSVYNLAGTIAPDGSVSGTSDSNCQTFTMPAGSAVAIPDEPTVNLPTSKDDCKKGGWMQLTDHAGNSFKNQGQCVSYVATGKV